MIDLGLTPREHEAYLAALRSSHRIRIHTEIRDSDEQPIDSLTAPANKVLDGSVQVDSTADVSRSLSLTVLDPKGKLRFEPNSPAPGAVFADRFCSVRYEVFVEDVLADWVSVPVFWGPLTAFSRSGAEVALEAQGKESLLLAPHYATHGYTIKERTRLDDAIREVADRMGERRYRLPDLPHRLTRAYAVHSQAEPWKVLGGGKNVAGFRGTGITIHGGVADESHPAAGLVSHAPNHYGVYYDARGRLTVRRLNKRAAYTFAEGRDLTSPPEIAYDTEAFRNCVQVTGGKPKGKKAAFGKAVLPASHPLSPQSLARNGVPRFLTEFRRADGLKKDSECEKRAHEILDRLSQEGVDASFECLPAPHVEEDDIVRLKTSEFSFTFPLKQWTLPLSSGEAMSVGANKRVSLGRKRHTGHNRRHRHRHWAVDRR